MMKMKNEDTKLEQIVLETLLNDFSLPEVATIWLAAFTEKVATRLLESELGHVPTLEDKLAVERLIKEDILFLFRHYAEANIIEKYEEFFGQNDGAIDLKFFLLPGFLRTRLESLPRLSVPTQPEGWNIVENDKSAELIHSGKVILSFAQKHSDKFRFFKCLWVNYGRRVPYSELFDFESDNSRYARQFGRNENQHSGKTHKRIRNVVEKLRKDLPSDGAFSITALNGGYKLLVEER